MTTTQTRQKMGSWAKKVWTIGLFNRFKICFCLSLDWVEFENHGLNKYHKTYFVPKKVMFCT
jgi:hypothetical protein